MNDRIVVLGGGLAGLSAGFFLSESQKEVVVLEKDPVPGGLAKTIQIRKSRFDLGGHRFLTEDRTLLQTVENLLGEELSVVSRKSKILKNRRYFDYPLQPLNAIGGVGIADSLKIVASYCSERLRKNPATRKDVSLEDWVVGRFGRVLFHLFFREYSEKVWGMPCNRMDADLAARRIGGLSLTAAVRRSLTGANGGVREPKTIKATFLYPSLGIGRISERLVDEIEARGGSFVPDSEVVQLHHDGHHIRSVSVAGGGAQRKDTCRNFSCREFEGDQFISSIPITSLVSRMNPRPPREVLTAAQSLRYRDLVIVAVLLNRPRITDQTWIYVPDREIPFGRIHEPANWSPKMTSSSETVLVAEYFCSEGDSVWSEPDGRLSDRTIGHLQAMGLIEGKDVSDSRVVRVPKAYPVPQVGYETPFSALTDYLSRIKNLQVIGRTGRFRYLNMDEVMKDGLEAARTILSGNDRWYH